MFVSLALSLALLEQDGSRVELTRVRDTYITSQEVEANYGRLPTLVGSQVSAILLDFPEIRDPNVTGEIVRATLSLQALGTDTPEIRSVGLIKRPWSEGGGPLVERLLPQNSKLYGATWNQRVDGIPATRWSMAGGRDEADLEILSGVTGARDGEKFLILGLAEGAKKLREMPHMYYGLRIDFTGVAEFESSERGDVGPTLLLDFEGGPSEELLTVGWIGRDVTVDAWPSNGSSVAFETEVFNGGNSAVQNVVVDWVVDGRLVRTSEPVTIQEGGSVRVRTDLEWQSDRLDRRWPLLGVRIRSVSDQTTLAYLAVPMSGLPISVPEETWSVFVNEFGTEGAGWVVSEANRRLNDIVLPWSRFSTTPQGPMEGLQIGRQSSPMRVTGQTDGFADEEVAVSWLIRESVRAATGLHETFVSPGYGDEWPVADETPLPPTTYELLPRVGVLPDTRDDGFWSTPLPLPVPFFLTSLAGSTQLDYHGQISRTEASILQAQVGKSLSERGDYIYNIPSTIFVRVFDPVGAPWGTLPVTIYRVDRGRLSSILWEGTTSRQGAIFMSSLNRDIEGVPPNPIGEFRTDGSDSWLVAAAELNGKRSYAWIPLWSLWDEYYRGDRRNGFIEVRFELPRAAIDETTDLARERIVTDSEGRFPAQLAAVVDGDSETGLTIPAGDGTYWIELDLGRDRPISAVEIEFGTEALEQVIVSVHKTGQTASLAQRFGMELSIEARMLRQRSDRTVRMYGPETLGRYVRILTPRTKEAEITGIRVFGSAP